MFFYTLQSDMSRSRKSVTGSFHFQSIKTLFAASVIVGVVHSSQYLPLIREFMERDYWGKAASRGKQKKKVVCVSLLSVVPLSLSAINTQAHTDSWSVVVHQHHCVTDKHTSVGRPRSLTQRVSPVHMNRRYSSRATE